MLKTPSAGIDDPDRTLVRAAAGGDTVAFERLYRLHVARVHGTLLRLAGQRALAEDWTQEAFVRAWQHLPGFRGESTFASWLHRLAVNVALMGLRAAAARVRGDGDDALLADLEETDGVGAALRMDLERAVAGLPPRARAVLVLHDVEGWKHEDISAALGMAVGTSKALLHRARRALRRLLAGDEAGVWT